MSDKIQKTSKFTPKQLGIMYIMGAAFFFALMNLFVQTSGDIPVMQKSFFRNIVALAIAIAVIIKDGEKVKFVKGSGKYLFMRSFFGTLGILFNFYAISHLDSISDASILNKLAPFFAIIFSIFLIHEKPDKKEVLCVIVAFCGALFVVRPSFNNFNFMPALIGAISGMFAGFAYTNVRKLGLLGEKSANIVLVFSAFSCITMIPYLIYNYTPMNSVEFWSLMGAGVSAAGGQFCITNAYKSSPAKEISVFDYTQVLFAALLGFIFLEQIPDRLSYVGYAIIIAASVYRWHLGNRS